MVLYLCVLSDISCYPSHTLTNLFIIWLLSVISMLYGHIQLNVYIYNYTLNIIKHNDDFNERTNTLLYKIYLLLFILERVAKGLRKGWSWLCVRGELETRTGCNILTQSFSRNHSSTSSSSWLGYSTGGHWGPKLFVWSWFSLRGYPISHCDWNSLPRTD